MPHSKPTAVDPAAHPRYAKQQAAHEANQAARKAAADPAIVQKAAAYFNGLDDSHKYAFLIANPRMEGAMVLVGYVKQAEINRLLEGSATQTTDGKSLDPSVTEPVFI